MPELKHIAFVAALATVITATTLHAEVITSPANFQTDSIDLKKSFLPLIEHMERNMRYPSQARSEKTQGNVIIQFELTTEGIIGNTELVNADEVKTMGNGLGDEALNVLRKFKDKKKRLKPGVYFLPLTFVLDMDNPPAPIDATMRKRPNCLYNVLISAGGFRN